MKALYINFYLRTLSTICISAFQPRRREYARFHMTEIVGFEIFESGVFFPVGKFGNVFLGGLI